MLIKELTQLNGVSGNEDKVREYILDKVKTISDEQIIDSMGNLIVYKKGRSSQYKIMLSAHMDEVGFMITGYNESGGLKFKTVGGIDERILPGKKVIIGDDNIIGVIGSKPIHLQKNSERRNVKEIKELYIDIGCKNKDEAQKKILQGTYGTFYSMYNEFGNNLIKAKALDDRVGCAILIEALKQKLEFDLYACFTVQEEVGLRGSEIAAYRVNPDLALVIEGTTCSDVPETEQKDFSTVLGNGPAVTIMDRTAYGDKGLIEFIQSVADKHNIQMQYKTSVTGGNDAGKIQLSRGGVRVAAISVPCRYIHSPVSVMHKGDFESCRDLVINVLKDIKGFIK